jgi:fructokinase
VAAEWLEAGPALIAVTRGGAGSSAFARSGRIDVPVKPATVVDTVGAGDSYMSGLLAGLHEERLLAVERRADFRSIDLGTVGRVVRMATDRAAWTVGRAGA